MEYGYAGALVAAGAKVLAFEEFGDYQGTWVALVEYEGKRGWVSGCFGSCSGCDALQSEFDTGADKCSAHRWAYPEDESCEACKEAKVAYDKKWSEFGKSYLDPIRTPEEAEAHFNRDRDWDMDADKLYNFIVNHRES